MPEEPNPQQNTSSSDKKVQAANAKSASAGTAASVTEAVGAAGEALQQAWDDFKKILKGEEPDVNKSVYENEEWARVESKNPAPMGFSNGDSMNITIFFAPRYVVDEKKRFDKDELLFVDYNERVKRFVIEDDIERFGWAGFLDFVNTGEVYNYILDRINCYYLIINITSYLGDGKRIKYEPYICDVIGVENLSDPQDAEQVIRLRYVDILQGIAHSHSIASVMKIQGSLAKMNNYKDVFSAIVSYLLRFVKTNTDGNVELKKDIFFNTETHNTNLQTLVEYSFKKLDPTATILEAIQMLLRDCGTGIKATQGFLEKYNDIGNVIIPFFVREEYGDFVGAYQAVFEKSSAVKKTQKRLQELKSGRRDVDRSGELVYQNFGDTDTVMLYRPVTMRDLYMPFQLAFIKDQRLIYESINPAKNEDGTYTDVELSYTPINGRTEVPIDEYKFYPMEPALAAKSWKNMIICNSGAEENSTVLITFNWIYKYFVNVFLGADGQATPRISNITPDFFLVQETRQNKDVGLVSDFNEMNSNFFVTRSKDDTNETLMLIGKQITQMVYHNSAYTFTIQGNLLRRPNEIIKFSRNLQQGDTNDSSNLYTDFAHNDYTLLYITRVRHVFVGPNYYNVISANRIYDSVANETRDEL